MVQTEIKKTFKSLLTGKLSKVAGKLELHPLDRKSKVILESAFREGGKLADLIENYLPATMKARMKEGKGYPKLRRSDIRFIKDVAKRNQVLLPADTIELKIKKAYENLKAAHDEYGSISKFPMFADSLQVRVTKVTDEGKRYKRNLTLHDYGGCLGASLSLGCCREGVLHKRTAKFFIAGEVDKEPFTTIKRAIKGDGVYLGDPSTIVKRKGDRFFLHLSVTRNLGDEVGNLNRILGLDLGVSGPLAGMFVVEFDRDDSWRLVESKLVKSGRMREAWRKLIQQRSRKASSMMRGKGGSKKGIKVREETAIGQSLHSERTTQMIYKT